MIIGNGVNFGKGTIVSGTASLYNNNNGSMAFNGDIAAAHAYNRALTASEHAQNATYWLSRYNGSSPT